MSVEHLRLSTLPEKTEPNSSERTSQQIDQSSTNRLEEANPTELPESSVKSLSHEGVPSRSKSPASLLEWYESLEDDSMPKVAHLKMSDKAKWRLRYELLRTKTEK